MGELHTDLMTLAVAERCPACSAALRPGAPWCTLCYADLRPPEPEPEPEPDPVVASVPPGPRHALDPGAAPPGGPDLTASAAGVAEGEAPPAEWPCTTCQTRNALSVAECTTCGAGFLAGVREDDPPLLTLPGLGDITRLSRAQRIGLAALVPLVVALVTFVLSLLTN